MIEKVETPRKMVAVTFDDGPNPVYTPRILDLFKNVSGKATFFMIGEHMVMYPEIVKTAIALGHEIGNHTYSHPDLTLINRRECLHEIQYADEVIKNFTGRKPEVFRPPYFRYNEDVEFIVNIFGYRTIGAVNVDALDWEQPGRDHIIAKTRECISNGVILLFHDGFGDRSQTVEAVEVLIEELFIQGYEFVTVSDLLQPEKELHKNDGI